MKKIYLKTTKLSFKEEDKIKDLQYLGDWCYNLEEKLIEKSNYYLLSQENKEQKFKKLLFLKDKILISLIEYLNTTHQIKKSFKYWNFLVGPWLIQFLHVLHDRWMSIEHNTKKNKDNLFTIICNVQDDLITPDEMLTAKHFYYQDLWNHYIFGEIIKYRKEIEYSIANVNFENINYKLNKKFDQKNLKKKIFDYFFYFSRLFYSEKKINKIIFSSDLHYKFQIKTLMKFNQFPIFLKLPPKYKTNKIDNNVRSKRIEFKIDNDFEKFVSLNLIKYLPKSILENYVLIENINLKFYKKFKSENYFIPQLEVSDQLKFFLSNQESSKKIIYQHGGAYGFMKFHYRELIETQVSDYFLTFGWDKNNTQDNLEEKDKQKVIDFFPIHLSNKKFETKNNKSIYLILDEFPNYFFEYQSNVNSHTYRLYFQGIINFITKLNDEVKKDLIVRLYPEKHNKDAYKILKDKFPNLNIDDGSQNIMVNLKNSKLCIISNNSTTFLQTLRINIPTIVFWDETIVESRKSSMHHLNSLLNQGIFYKDPESAALFCNNNKNIYKWWNDINRKKTITEFLKIFANEDKNKIEKLYSIINDKKKD